MTHKESFGQRFSQSTIHRWCGKALLISSNWILLNTYLMNSNWGRALVWGFGRDGSLETERKAAMGLSFREVTLHSSRNHTSQGKFPILAHWQAIRIFHHNQPPRISMLWSIKYLHKQVTKPATYKRCNDEQTPWPTMSSWHRGQRKPAK